jgi:hypothetical protein
MAKIFRGNLLNVRKQIEAALALKLDAADQRTATPVTGATSPALADIKHDTTFQNTGAADYTVTLPTSLAADQVGKRFHFTASQTWSNALTVTCSTTGLMRDSSNTGAPYTVNDGTLTVTVVEGLASARYYSVSGDYS